MAINLRNDKFVEKGNAGGGGNPKAFDEINATVQTELEKIKTIARSIENFNFTQLDRVVFFIEYKKKIPPKSRRFIFNTTELPNSLLDVRQRSITSKKLGKDVFVRIFYEIEKDEHKTLLATIRKFLNYSISVFTREKDDEFLKKVLYCEKFSQEYESLRLISKSYVSTLPLPWAFEDLVARGIISRGDFRSELNIAFLDQKQFKKINQLYPFLIIDVFGKLNLHELPINILNLNIVDNPIVLTQPRETTIGVIDSGNNLPAPFSQQIVSVEDWREYGYFSSKNHGSMVSSLIIANDELNPGARDGLGNFRVKHFEMFEPFVEGQDVKMSFIHLRSVLEQMIQANGSIKVWNMSHGILKSPYSPIMSKIGAFLDAIAKKYNVLFIVAAGNSKKAVQNPMESLHAPGDSLNSLTVGSIQNIDGNVTPSDYSSIGQILYFEKPEISTYGGPRNGDDSQMVAYYNGLNYGISGTSLSTPRIARLAAHLIDEGYSPIEAKAKILSMTKRESPKYKSASFGWIDYSLLDKPTLKVSIPLSNKNPQYLDVNIPDVVEEVIISASHFVTPNPIFGEEYSVHNFETGLIWYDSNAKMRNPEWHHLTKKVNSKEKWNNDNKYFTEEILRLESGKYFSSSKVTFLKADIDNAKSEFLAKGKCSRGGCQLALRIKKLDLFETVEEQTENVSVTITLLGNLTEADFVAENGSIVDIDIDIDT